MITVKAGRTSAGAKAASSHTGSIVGMDFATESLLEQCGVIRANTMEEMLTLAQAFASQPLPDSLGLFLIQAAGRGQLPLKTGLRFSRKAARPSAKSALA